VIYQKYFKRLLDIILSIFALLIMSPIMLTISFVVKVDSSGPVFYRGIRSGRGDNEFSIFKFRTMVVGAESKGGYSTALNDTRFTRTGRFLRRYKLDEFPQFFNVICGEMSLVGPRPQVLYYTKKYCGEEKLILSVRPGITDIASLYYSDMDLTLGSGNVDDRYEFEIEPTKNKLRIRYVRDMSFMLDMRILIETAFKIVGVSNITGLRIAP
jgi:lipopolysaccharide/colanic/teichoic acid biosynthesis glycosyltransferase